MRFKIPYLMSDTSGRSTCIMIEIPLIVNSTQGDCALGFILDMQECGKNEE